MTNTILKEHFIQVFVWSNVKLAPNTPTDFENYMAKNNNGTRIQFMEEINTGNRNDILFAVHTDDLNKFYAVAKPEAIVRLDDIAFDEAFSCYPPRLEEYLLRKKALMVLGETMLNNFKESDNE